MITIKNIRPRQIIAMCLCIEFKPSPNINWDSLYHSNNFDGICLNLNSKGMFLFNGVVFYSCVLLALRLSFDFAQTEYIIHVSNYNFNWIGYDIRTATIISYLKTICIVFVISLIVHGYWHQTSLMTILNQFLVILQILSFIVNCLFCYELLLRLQNDRNGIHIMVTFFLFGISLLCFIIHFFLSFLLVDEQLKIWSFQHDTTDAVNKWYGINL